jgi:hypothetical protein
MSYDADMAVFFQRGDPGIAEALHVDEAGDEHPLIGEFVKDSQQHEHGSRHINQSNPVFTLPAIEANAVEIGDKLIIEELGYEVVEKLAVDNGICALYLTREKLGGDHRWQ